jgi:hypothetical protein
MVIAPKGILAIALLSRVIMVIAPTGILPLAWKVVLFHILMQAQAVVVLVVEAALVSL